MLKFICLLIMFAGVSYIGIELGSNYSKKEKFFSELNMFCNMLINNIKFNKNKISVVINDNINNYSSDLKEYLSCFLNDKLNDLSFINKYQNQKIREFFLGLGSFDTSNEINYINNYKILFEEFLSNSKEENKKYGALYSKLGIMVGLILVILFI